MILSALTDTQEIASAFQVMAQGLQQDSQPFDINVGWPGGGEDLRIYWQLSAGLWSLAEAFSASYNGYWFGFGTDDPEGRTKIAPEVQIGMAGSGNNRRFAGVFAQDSQGRIYATHNGRFQIGYQRTKPEDFLNAHSDHKTGVVRWPDGLERIHLIVAAIDDPDLVAQISAFVRTVKIYKSNLRRIFIP